MESRTEHKYEEIGIVRGLPESGRSTTVSEIDRGNIMLTDRKFRHSIDQSHKMSNARSARSNSVHRFLKCEKYKTYKVNVIHHIFSDNPGRKTGVLPNNYRLTSKAVW